MSDKVIKIGQSIVQHGEENDRVYLMKVSANDLPDIITRLNSLADRYGYSKIFAKIPATSLEAFVNEGYRREAVIPRFYNNDIDCYFVSKFLSRQRSQDQSKDKVKSVIAQALTKKQARCELSSIYSVRKMTKSDTDQMAPLYQQVFKTYPFPIHEQKYLVETMDNDVVYFGILHDNRLVAVSSCEVYRDQANAEMTDFATLPDYRGKNFALVLLDMMEKELKIRKIHTAYTIARACSYGMNVTFAKAGYHFAGTLINNTNICGNIESMNVWHKPIF